MIKLDIEKAYDGLERNFIRDTLLFFNFPSQLISLIMNCISLAHLSILLSGSPLSGFNFLEAFVKVIPYPLTFSSFAWNIYPLLLNMQPDIRDGKHQDRKEAPKSYNSLFATTSSFLEPLIMKIYLP